MSDRGRLTVFVGAAPGAGKTYAMLYEGRRLRDSGRRVLVGLVETYERPRTLDALADLPVVPPRHVQYGGHEFATVDVSAILEAAPEVVLIDEIYRLNPPECGHGRRWEDIEEIRDAGIDVLTTMNIQHLEGMKDIAESIAGITIRETVPDELIEQADEIQLVDISPEALRKRMQHGNIYPRDTIEGALTGFFRPGNLAALREMSLRWLAEVEKRLSGVAERLPSEHVLVAVRPRPEAQLLVRRAARMARRYRGGCTVVVVLRPGEAPNESLHELKQIASLLRVDFVVEEDSSPERAIARAVRDRGATQLILGEPQGGNLLTRYRGDIVDHLIEQFPGVDVHVISRSRTPSRPAAPDATTPTEPVMAPNPSRYLRVYLGYAPGCGTTTAMLMEGQRRRSRGTDVVVAVASAHGRPETHEAMAGMEVMPPLPTPGRGSPDLDLGAILARQPDVCCVDDLAHHNRSGQLLEWRYQEVERMLEAGIRVISTLHVFDIEGIADILGPAGAGLSRNPVSRHVLDMATEVELVDVSPHILLARLQQERERTGERREAMIDLELLTRLREAALRLVAAQTENKLIAYMQQRGISQPWESTPRVMACVSPGPGMERVIRKAAETARRVDGKLEVVTVITGKASPEQDRLLAGYAAQAASAGGQFVSLHSGNVAESLLEHAQHSRVTEILILRGDGMRGSEIKSCLLHRTSGIDIHVLRDESHMAEPEPAADRKTETAETR